MEKLDHWAANYKALSEPLRIRLLSIISTAKDICVCDLVAITGVSQSMVSRHLAYLRNSGWLHARREKLWMHYSIAKQDDEMAQAILKALQQHGPLSKQINIDLANLSKLGESASGC
ncbi:MAG: helix-turn-helix transcriptional regulator [Magnetococcales bacterium]|nr:helix-turn-helix transcriptional regulator [Magnetococcales bacterium]